MERTLLSSRVTTWFRLLVYCVSGPSGKWDPDSVVQRNKGLFTLLNMSLEGWSVRYGNANHCGTVHTVTMGYADLHTRWVFREMCRIVIQFCPQSRGEKMSDIRMRGRTWKRWCNITLNLMISHFSSNFLPHWCSKMHILILSYIK